MFCCEEKGNLFKTEASVTHSLDGTIRVELNEIASDDLIPSEIYSGRLLTPWRCDLEVAPPAGAGELY